MKAVCLYCHKEYEIPDNFNWIKGNNLGKGKGTVSSKKYCCYDCGKKARLVKYEETSLKKYGTKNPSLSNVVINKIKNTKEMQGKDLEYIKQVTDKRKQTTKLNHGYENYRNIDKAKETFKQHYGTEHNMKSKEGFAVYQASLEKKYGKGIKNQFQREEIKQHNKKVHLKKYGVEYVSQSDYYKKKCYETKKKNHTFKISKVENKILLLLKQKFKDVKYQYRSDKYPFNCDFYVVDKDLYIEYQGHWTHNTHAYTGSKNDIKKIKEWKDKNTLFYEAAIKTWTERDVIKRNIAKENNLNWLEFFNFDQFMDWFKIQ